jgi:hypothetical protein
MPCKRLDKNSYKSEWTDERRNKHSEMMSGENNPNFGNRWSDEQRLSASVLKKQQFAEDQSYAFRCGKSNRGIKFSKDRIIAMHKNRTFESYSHPHSVETKQVIGQKSKEKWTTEFRQKFRKTMEDSGHWVPLDDIHPYKAYYKNADWTERMIDYFSEDEIKKLKSFGIYSSKNTAGFVRDHIVPRKIGYEFEIPAYIMRHPANLQFISHKENISKGFKDRKLTQSEKEYIIEILLEKIEKFSSSWKEQECCLIFIKERKKV